MSDTEPTLDQALEAAFDSIQAAGTDEQNAGRQRDERGRFASAAEGAQQEIPAGQEPAPDANTDQGDEPTTEPAEQPLSPPERWSADRKAKFAALPREAQELLLEREGEIDKAFTQKTQELASQRRNYEALDQVLEPRRQALVTGYGSEANAIKQLLELSDFADRDPKGFVKWFSSQRGIDTAPPAQEGPKAELPPEIAPIVNEVNQIKQMLYQREQDALVATIDSFQKDPAHPHFAECQAAIMRLIPVVKAEKPTLAPAEILKEAYDTAVWANPTVREAMLSEQRRAEEARRVDEAKAAAARAKKAAGTTITTKASVNGAPAGVAGSWQENLGTVYDSLHGAA